MDRYVAVLLYQSDFVTARQYAKSPFAQEALDGARLMFPALWPFSMREAQGHRSRLYG